MHSRIEIGGIYAVSHRRVPLTIDGFPSHMNGMPQWLKSKLTHYLATGSASVCHGWCLSLSLRGRLSESRAMPGVLDRLRSWRAERSRSTESFV